MNTKTYWLILEGQNFNASILDTQDLSTIRGGSIGLKTMVEDANTWLINQASNTGSGPRLKSVQEATLGGSIGVWRIDADETSAAKLPAALETHMRLDKGENRTGKHLGFGIGLIADDGRPYSVQRERLKAAMQRQRLSVSRTPFPALPEGSPRVCEFDFVRPADGDVNRQIKFGSQSWRVSPAVWDRRELGKQGKQKLIRTESGILEDNSFGNSPLSPEAKSLLEPDNYPFAIQINSISERKDWRGKLKSNLQDKICVIALDGNSFSAVQKDRLKANDTIAAQRTFDTQLRALRTKIVCAALNAVVERGGFGDPSDQEMDVRKELTAARLKNIIRFEMLLWGGDEIMFIVPARVGFDVMQAIAKAADDEKDLVRKKTDANGKELDVPLTFSVGAVFCHHDAPIARIKRLADELAEHIKGLKKDASGKGINGKDQNLFLTAVLESFDHVGVDTAAYLDARVPKSTLTTKVDGKDESIKLAAAERAAFAVLDAGQINILQKSAQELAAGKGGKVSRGRLRQTANTLHHGWAPGEKYAGNWRSYVTDAKDKLTGDTATACKTLGQDRFFALLEDYWDYLTPEEQDQNKQPEQGGATS